MIVEKVLETKRSRIRSWPVHTNRASELGHECLRYLVLQRTRSAEKALHGVDLELIFELGNLFEKKVLSDLAEAGITVIEQQRFFEWKEYQLTGHCDGKVLFEGKAYPLETKSSSPYIFDTIKDIGSLKNSRFLYLRKYVTQLNLYCLMSEADKGVFVFANKSTGQLKEIWMDVDRELGKRDLAKATLVNRHVAEGTLPELPPETDSICPGCAYEHVCAPSRRGEGVIIENNQALEELLDRRESLASSWKEYEDVDRQLKQALREKDKVFIGDYYITGRWQERKESVVKASRFWVAKLAKMLRFTCP